MRAADNSAGKPVIRVINAAGAAASFYQVASAQGAKAAPNLNYVKGKAITVNFGADRAVSRVTVREQASGIYLERIPDDSVKTDSTAAGATKAAKTDATKPATPPVRTPPSGAAAAPPPTPVRKP